MVNKRESIDDSELDEVEEIDLFGRKCTIYYLNDDPNVKASKDNYTYAMMWCDDEDGNPVMEFYLEPPKKRS